jgi:hypothetical protein
VIVSDSPVSNGASPPVPSTVTGPASGPSSSTIRRTSPSTCPAKPYSTPDCRHSTVFFPITERGRTSSTVRSAAARVASASSEISIPGASAPPRNSPFAETTSMFVEVPKSTTTHAVSNNRCAARVFITRSAPTSRGLSTSSGTPVRTPGPTTTAGTSLRSMSSRSSRSSVGTVESAATPVTRSAYRPSSASNAMSSSSAVIRGSVRIRQSRTSGGSTSSGPPDSPA